MKKMTISKGAATCVVLVTVLMSAAGASFAWGPGSQQHHGKGMHNCTGDRFKNRAEMMKSALNLTDEQQVLLEEMHQATMEFKNVQCPDRWTPDCMKNRQQMRTMHLFRAELAAENPDFQGVAEKVKNEYTGENKEEFDSAVDARARFMESLTPEQRDTMMQMKFHGRHGGANAMRKGPKT